VCGDTGDPLGAGRTGQIRADSRSAGSAGTGSAGSVRVSASPSASTTGGARSFSTARHLIVHMPAERERALAENRPTPRTNWHDAADGLIDALVGLRLAPVGPRHWMSYVRRSYTRAVDYLSYATIW
jgi:hypothetical protein